MSDVMTDAAEALVPLIYAGAGATARDVAERGGAELADRVARLVAKLRSRLTGSALPVADVELALRSEIAAGTVTFDELARLVALRPTVGGVHGVHVHGDVKTGFFGGDIRIDTINNQ
jgi:hypothetical protein